MFNVRLRSSIAADSPRERREAAPVDDTGESGQIDPRAITVCAAVNVVYTIAGMA